MGYNVDALIAEIRKILRTSGQHNIALVGAGRLGQAIAGSTCSPTTASTSPRSSTPTPRRSAPLGDVAVGPTTSIACRDKNIIVGVIAVPAPAAQNVCDQLVGSGIKIVFNYSGALQTPADVTVHSTSPAVELLYALYFYLT